MKGESHLHTWTTKFQHWQGIHDGDDGKLYWGNIMKLWKERKERLIYGWESMMVTFGFQKKEGLSIIMMNE